MINKLTVFLVCVHLVGSANETKPMFSTGKTQNDKWDWGYAETSTKSAGNSEIPPIKSSNSNAVDPCAPYTPTMPDFRKPGRRISESKCFEYIWHINFREERDRRKSTCSKNDINNLLGRVHVAVVGGRNSFPGEYPHMGALGWKAADDSWVFKCGSSLISSKFVLTAAHCSRLSDRDATVADPVPKIVRLGKENIISFVFNPSSVDAYITRIIVHPKYASPKKYYDIALMELEKDVEFTKNVQPACLWSNIHSSNYGTEARVTGWGVTESGGFSTSPKLQVALVDLVNTDKCDELLRPSCNRLWCGVQDHQICAGKLSGGIDTCQGDSGGPLQVKIHLPVTSQGSLHYVIGVTSFGVGCARSNTPGVYSRVSSFIDWIEENVWK